MASLLIQLNIRYTSETIVSNVLSARGIVWRSERFHQPQQFQRLAMQSLSEFIPHISLGVLYASSMFQRRITRLTDRIWSYLVSHADFLSRPNILVRVLTDVATAFIRHGYGVLYNFVYMAIVINVCIYCAISDKPDMIRSVIDSLVYYFTASGEFLQRLHQLQDYVVQYVLPTEA